MKVYEIKEQKVVRKVAKDTYCNKCGRSVSLCGYGGGLREGTQICISFISDDDGYVIDICKDCFNELNKSFKFPAQSWKEVDD